MDQINESVDIIVQYGSADRKQKMIQLSHLNFISPRPLYSIHHRDILSIREYFKEKNYLLLTTYATMNQMYLCSKIEMDQKVSEHFMQTKAYEIHHVYNNMNVHTHMIQDFFQTVFNSVNQLIDSTLLKLFRRRHITVKQYGQMLSTSKRDENPINSMIFLPDTRTVSVDVFFFLSSYYIFFNNRK